MNSQVPSEPRTLRDDAIAVLQRLRNAGHVAYFAGGCVRDLLLKLEPSDFDIATNAPPHRVRELFRNSQAVGAAFGVVLVRVNASQIEVATFRADGEYTDGRRPESVRFTTAEEDAQRRDFTINGLFLDPISGEVIDYVGGRDDLAARRLRAIGTPAARFAEDHLRMLRAVRFAARFNFAVEPDTADAIQSHASQLERVSPERIAEELRKMLTPARSRTAAWDFLRTLALAPVLFRQIEIRNRASSQGEPMFFGTLAQGAEIPFGLALAAATFCYQRSWSDATIDPRSFFSRAAVQSVVQAMRQTLRISNEESELLEGILSDLDSLLSDAAPTLAMKKRFLARPSSPESRAMLEGLGRLDIYRARVASLQHDFAAMDDTDIAPRPLLNGDDLISNGFLPGPRFKRILDSVYDAQLESRVHTPEQALALARQLAT